MTSVISYETDKIKINLGGITFPGDAVDMNRKSVTIGGLAQPLLAYDVPETSLTIDYPSDDYEDEPIVVYINGFILEQSTLPDPDTPEPWTISITAPTAGATLTESGTATAVVKDQFGSTMPSATVTWSEDSDAEKLSINASSGAYTLVADGDVVITATSSTVSTLNASVGVTVDTT